MKDQWALQKQILARERSLGIIGQLPGFQGNVPLALKDVHQDANITKQGDTGWMYSTDPLFAKIADVWMQTIIADFGTDHWYQLDGYFNGGTAPWMSEGADDLFVASDAPACTWSPLQADAYLADCDDKCKVFPTVDAAKVACAADQACGGITSHGATSSWELRGSSTPAKSPSGDSSYYITNAATCHAPPPIPTDPEWLLRGKAAYEGLNRTDPDAIWSFQGWAFVGWSTQKQASSIKSFVDATPEGKFVVIDMSVNGEGEWKKWKNAAFFGAHFIWTTLHDFGGTDGLKGDLAHINEIPFAAMKPEADTNVWGTGFTPEGCVHGSSLDRCSDNHPCTSPPLHSLLLHCKVAIATSPSCCNLCAFVMPISLPGVSLYTIARDRFVHVAHCLFLASSSALSPSAPRNPGACQSQSCDVL